MNNIEKVFLVGAAKAGTTTVESVLSSNASISKSLIKEPNYYCKDLHAQFMTSKYNNLKVLESVADYEEVHSHAAIVKDEFIYEQLFSQGDIRLDASTNYLYSLEAASEIYKDDPDAKIIIILRDPIKRAYSHWLMDRRIGFRVQGFYEEIEKEYDDIANVNFSNSPLYVSRSLYFEQVKRYMELFNHDNVLVVFFEDLFSDKKEDVMSDIYSFVGLKYKAVFLEKKNAAQVPRFKFLNTFLQTSGVKVFLRTVLGSNVKNHIKRVVYKENDEKLNTELVRKDILITLKDDYLKTKELLEGKG
ncbi:sulfotransferase family protein [Amphritea balenae]|uniref:Sulfotransferase n=1 Tax=Amphritea balenae TaxID=452629 RepID=A0A3P1SSL8_9GAMM|nr:sulfotransferase [Amphritea balenae]RRD00184.1 sulfotransferase [Amphritea balenae]GGK77355.1 hypothetical protein GCM10007941_29380 [Amphritea balenae]